MPDGKLILCATPIGNLGDVSERLRDSLAAADVIYAEDTRRVAKLLDHLGISVPAKSLFTGNESARTKELVADVAAGQTVALVSDAGMPTVSDPGAAAVAAARAEGWDVEVIPGPSAVTTAVALAGYGGDRFVFEGFLPRKGRDRSRRIEMITNDERVVVLFASPKRVGDDLSALAAAGPQDRHVAVIREMTKLHEEVWSGSLSDAADYWHDRAVRGEVTLVLAPLAQHEPDIEAAVDLAEELMGRGTSASEAARQAAAGTGVSRREIYQRLIDQG